MSDDSFRSEGKPLESLMQERQMLLERLEKQHLLTMQWQETWQKEKTDLEMYYARREESLNKQIEQLKEERELTRKELERSYTQKDGEEGNFRILLLKELERLDFTAREKEVTMTQEIKTLKNQLNSLRASTSQNKTQVQEEKHYLQEQIEVARGEVKEIEEKYKKILKEMAAKLDRANKELYKKKQELERTKVDYEAQLKTLNSQKKNGDDPWTGEKKGYLMESSKLAARLQKREENVESQLRVLQQEKINLELFYSEKIQYLENQIKLLSDRLEEGTHLLQTALTAAINKTNDLSEANLSLNHINQNLEEKLKQARDQLETRLKRMQTQYDQRESTFIRDKKEHLKDIEKFQNLLKQYHQQEPAASLATEALRNEVTTLQTQLKEKEQQLINMRELYLNSKTAERRKISKTITAVQKHLADINSQQKFMLKEETNFSSALRELEQQATDKEKKQAQECLDLNQQLEALRIEYFEYKSLNLEKEIEQLKLENKELEDNVNSAYRNLKANEEIIDELRSQLQWSTDSGQNPTANEKIRLLQCEIGRINVENEELLKAKENITAFYMGELSKTKNLLDKKNSQISQILVKSDRSRTNKAKKHLEEVSAWQNRQLTFTKTIKSLENKIKDLNQQAATRMQLSSKERDLEAEELRLYRVEATQKEDMIEEHRKLFETEKRQMEAEIERLRGIIYSYSQTQDAKIELLNEEYELLKNNRARLIDTINAMDNQLKILASNSEIASNFGREQLQILETGIGQKLMITQKEVEALKHKVESDSKVHNEELNTFRTSAEREIKALRDIERALNKHIQVQQDEINQLTRHLTDEKQQHAEDLEDLRSELQALRKVNSSRHDHIHNEKVTLAHDLNRLLGLVEQKEDSNPFTEKFEEVEQFIQEKQLPFAPNTDPDTESDAEIFIREMAALKSTFKDRERLKAEEKRAISGLTHKLQKTIGMIQEDAEAQHEQDAKQLEIAHRKHRALLSEKESLKSQRDILLQTLSKSRSLSKTDRTAVSRLIDQLKGPVGKK